MRIVVAGGGSVGTFIGDELAGAGHDVVIVERDPSRVAKAGGGTSGARWICADACELSELRRADPATADVVVAVTGDDEDNLVISLLSKQEFAVPRVIARVNNPQNEWLFTDMWGVDVAVSTPHLLTGLVQEAVTVGNFVRLLALGGGNVRLAEVTLSPDSPAVDQRIDELVLPREAVIVAVIRLGHVVAGARDVRLLVGDEVVVLTAPDSEDAVRAVLIGH
jgi:trk system potassium uptake protein TrkA